MKLLGSKVQECPSPSDHDKKLYETNVAGVLNKTRKVLSVFGNGKYIVKFETHFRILYQIIDGFNMASWISIDKRFDLKYIKPVFDQWSTAVNEYLDDYSVETGSYVAIKSDDNLHTIQFDTDIDVDQFICLNSSINKSIFCYFKNNGENHTNFAKDLRIASDGIVMIKMGYSTEELWQENRNILMNCMFS